MKTFQSFFLFLSFFLPSLQMLNAQDLSVIKVASNATVNAGDPMEFTISVTNIGTADATNVIVTDVLPGGFNWSLAGPVSGFQISAGVLSGIVPTLPVGGSVTLTVSALATSAGLVINTATATADNESSNDLGNNTSTASITIGSPDLAVSKTAVTPFASVGDPIEFSITVSNNGPGDAYNVSLTDQLPLGYSWYLISPPAGFQITAGVLSGNLGTLSSGSTVTVYVGAIASSGGTVTNTASVAATNESGGTLGNNASTASITVLEPDVVVNKTALAPVVNEGDVIIYSIMISNIGQGVADNVTLTDVLPAGYAWSVSSPTPSFVISSGVLTGTEAELAPGASLTLTISAIATTPGTIVNTATVMSTNESSALISNNTSTAVITVNPAITAPSVTIDQSATQSDPTADSPVHFTVTFSEAVTDFTGSDVDLSAGTAPGTLTAVVTGGPVTYDVAVSGMTGDGTVVATIPADVAVNTSGTGNIASTSIDNTVLYIYNQCPVADDLSVSTTLQTSVSFQLPASDPDGDPLTYSIIIAPAHGTVVLNTTTGSASYTPSAGFIGNDQFKYQVNDGYCSSDATVTITVKCPEINFDLGPNRIVYKGFPDSACVRLEPTGISQGSYTYTWSPGGSHAGFINVCPNQTTVYYLTVTDGNGCSYTDSVQVCVIDVRCGTGRKNVLVCHGTGSSTNPYVTICIDKTAARWHFTNHPGEQLGACGMDKSCDFATSRLSDAFIIEEGVQLLHAMPNPFNSMTSIRFMLPQDEEVQISVFDISGRQIANLFNGPVQREIIYETSFDGSRFDEGIYFCRMTAGGYATSIKLLLVR
jgi:uncharacterized repeat protein (TIGR01451 family)